MRIRNIYLWLVAIVALSACSESSTNSDEKAGGLASLAKSASESAKETSPNNYEELERAALAGNYQAQRNLAYMLTTSIPRNPILGCAWRIVIVESGSEQVDQSDTGNKQFDCDKKLNADEVDAAKVQAKKLQGKIVKK